MYLRQTTSELTGEHTCVMVRGLNSSSEGELEWLGEFAKGASVRRSSVAGQQGADIYATDFRRRFLSLLSYKFREFGSVTALSVLEAANAGVKKLDDDPSRGPCLGLTRTWRETLTLTPGMQSSARRSCPCSCRHLT